MKLDTDNSGAIDKDEFLSIPGIGQNPLARRVIDIFDTNRGGDIDFKEFGLRHRQRRVHFERRVILGATDDGGEFAYGRAVTAARRPHDPRKRRGWRQQAGF
ncbi:hypothetical protein KL935_001956 [Ogataea polymorpha]|nr:hypothetical protein KL937_001373 [Ogataea polymorpha]KAG7901996.1 hypothetical protein KL935_001956 [Ogataea polymorpha]KAG7911031.1 hypothetical protein KL906_001411 [Ogataea polymorpha]KAG7918423.1 hypothetical protein KL927_001880 [Ogataea polymorpha]KAG7933542.1 hypothetical protein KL934_003352 [Ogataea polymorpha]